MGMGLAAPTITHDSMTSRGIHMGQSSILGGEEIPDQAGSFDQSPLGPSDTSDSGSDVAGEADMSAGDDHPLDDGPLDLDRTSTTRSPAGAGSDSDSTGTGERLGAEPNSSIDDGGDISPDRIIDDPNQGIVGEQLSQAELDDIAVDDTDEDDDEEADGLADDAARRS
jgi:hypothetical protein